MSKKIDELYDGRSMGQWARDHGAETHKVGSYIEIMTDDGRAYVPDSPRDMPKPDRDLVLRLLKAIIAAAILIAIYLANRGL